MKDNIERLLDAMEHPEKYSDAEVEQLLTDPEVREVYDMLHRAADVSAPVPEINLDEEWRRFEAKQPKRRPVILPWLSFMASRNAAAVVIALVSTLAVVATTIGLTHYSNADKETVATEQAEPQSQTAITASDMAPADTIQAEAAPLPETVIFKGENLEKILADMAVYYGATVKFNQDAAKSLQLYFEWDQSLPLNEVVGQLNNFEQINITLTDKVLTVK